MLALSKAVEIMKRRMIRIKLITAIMPPIIDNQFFDEGGIFMIKEFFQMFIMSAIINFSWLYEFTTLRSL